MKRFGVTVAALGIAGSVLLAPSVGHACERHERQAEAASASPEESPLREVDALLSAKCQCESAADCTCKKGQCECGKCKKPKRQVMDALREQRPTLRLEDARYDASAGIFI